MFDPLKIKELEERSRVLDIVQAYTLWINSGKETGARLTLVNTIKSVLEDIE